MTGACIRPSAPLRRQQVIEAASACFRANGFHATSMAQIAKAAGMSVGHIYRYFSGKEEIIDAIISHDVERHTEFMRALREVTPQRAIEMLLESVEEGVTQKTNHRSAALNAEIAAEAARNPKVAALLSQSDEQGLGMLRCALSRAAPPSWTEQDISARAETMALLFDGLSLRVIKHPDMDKEGLFKAMRVALAALLEP